MDPASYYQANKRTTIKLALALVLLLVIITSVIIILVNRRPKAPSELTLTVWGTEDVSVFQKTFDSFIAAHPSVKISYKEQRLARYRERLSSNASSAQEGPRPDVFVFHNTWVPMLKNVLAPLPETIVDQKTYESTFYAAAAADLVLGKNFVGLPLSADGLALYVNSQLLQAKGIEPPKDWESFLKAANQLTVASEPDDAGRRTIQTAGAAMGTAKNVEYFSDIIGLMFIQQQSQLALIGTDDDANSIIQYYAKFAKGNERVWDATLEPAVDAFAKGKVAMMFAPAARAGDIKAKNPNLVFTTAPVPQLRVTEPQTWASYWAWGVSKNSQGPMLAWQLAWSLSSQASLIRANQKRIVLTGYGLPYPRADMARRQQNDPVLGAYILQAQYAKSLPIANQTRDNGLNDQLIHILDDLVTKLNNNIGSGAIEEAGKDVNEVLKTWGLPYQQQ